MKLIKNLEPVNSNQVFIYDNELRKSDRIDDKIFLIKKKKTKIKNKSIGKILVDKTHHLKNQKIFRSLIEIVQSKKKNFLKIDKSFYAETKLIHDKGLKNFNQHKGNDITNDTIIKIEDDFISKFFINEIKLVFDNQGNLKDVMENPFTPKEIDFDKIYNSLESSTYETTSKSESEHNFNNKRKIQTLHFKSIKEFEEYQLCQKLLEFENQPIKSFICVFPDCKMNFKDYKQWKKHFFDH